MGLTKDNLYDTKVLSIVKFTKALAHPARLAIINILLKAEGCICGDLVDEIGLSQPTISQHLKELKDVGLITGTVSGTSVCYCIDNKVWKTMGKQLSRFIEQEPHYTSKNC